MNLMIFNTKMLYYYHVNQDTVSTGNTSYNTQCSCYIVSRMAPYANISLSV